MVTARNPRDGEYDFRKDYDAVLENRTKLLRPINPEVVRAGWFALSHMLLDRGAKVVDMGCRDGAMTYVMAALNPTLHFIGVDKSTRNINRAKTQFKLDNLEFRVGDVSKDLFEPESVDAIINSYILHGVFSGSRYNERIVSDTLARHFKALKKDGTMFLRDYARPPPEEFVLLEMPDIESTGNDLKSLSEPDLLVWYSEHARPRQDPGCGGFFLEELPPRFPETRLFRLPYKWAYEFIMRKDDREHWETELPVEYTFFTTMEFRRELRALGARIQYSGPYWDEDVIDKKFDGHFRLYADDGTPLGNPPTCFVAVAQKVGERKSINIEERRPTVAEETSLQISAVRNEHTGELLDIVSRGLNLHEIIPYRISKEGFLKIYVHDGVARAIANTMPRNGTTLDGKRWSGHMIEAIAIDSVEMGNFDEFDVKNSVLFARDYLGLKPESDAVLERGPDYYPAPDYIDEQIITHYLEVQKTKSPYTPKPKILQGDKFQAKGVIREIDAQQILNAITVGLIPNARLELQILSLYQKLNIKVDNWTSKQLAFQVGKLKQPKSMKDLLRDNPADKMSFKNIKGTTGQLRSVHSAFVEEGQTRGAVTGLTAQTMDFVIFDEKTINTAVVLPLTKGVKQQVHAGFDLKFLPIPQRHEGNGLTLCAPSFDLPRNVTNIKLAKQFIAEKFGVAPEMVLRLGEPYFTHVGVTPQRIFPFAISVPPSAMKNPDNKFLPFYQLMLLRRSLARDTHFMILLARAYKYLNDEIRLDAKMKVKNMLQEKFEYHQPDWSIPIHYHRAPGIPIHKSIDLPFVESSGKDKEKPDEEIKKVRKAIREARKEQDDKPDKNLKPTPLPPNLIDDFEEELEAFIEDLEKEKDETLKPTPEKW